MVEEEDVEVGEGVSEYEATREARVWGEMVRMPVRRSCELM
jgi:hypothetical protein